jgi:hypothetical protein
MFVAKVGHPVSHRLRLVPGQTDSLKRASE